MSIDRVSISPADYDAVIFDLDGVVTRTADLHFKAWKELFDQFLKKHGHEKDLFSEEDYRGYVDGKPRLDGIESFLASRNISLPRGTEEDSSEDETVHGLGRRKNRLFHQLIREEGVEVYPFSLGLINEIRSAGLAAAVVSSSRNCRMILQAAEIDNLFDVMVDGNLAWQLQLKGKPEPDIFLEAARRLEVSPGRAAVLEDAAAGVRAGAAGGFGLVIGVDRTGQAEALLKSGANFVLDSLSRVKIDNSGSDPAGPPSALNGFEEIAGRLKDARAALFLDYDGTLTPIVEDPDQAFLSRDMQKVLKQLADHVPIAVISGRDRTDVQKRVGLENIYYAGSHGFDISGPDLDTFSPDKVRDFMSSLDHAESELRKKLKSVEGVLVERKKYSIALHYRRAQEKDISRVKEAVERISSNYPGLGQSGGKKVFELKPNMDWDKGKALLLLLDRLNPDKSAFVPIYMGDDLTDEDAFEAVQDRGVSIVVMESPGNTKADYRLKNIHEVKVFLEKLLGFLSA